ncbi:MAG: ABC transporter permease [Hyphomicrobiaceae bacterium]
MLRAYVILYVVVLFGPLFFIALFSFHSSGAMTFPMEGLSLTWYRAFFADHVFVESFKFSLIVGFTSTLVTTVVGSLVAIALARLKGWPKQALGFLTFAPIALPGLFIGIALLTFFGQIGMERTLKTVTIAHILIMLPFFIEASRSRLEYFDLSLEEAARDLGATPWNAFRLVTLPIIAPTLIGAAILSFAISFDEVIITVFVSGSESTLPLAIWSSLRRTATPIINAASVLALASVLLLILTFAVLGWWRRRRKIIGRQAIEGTAT